MKICFISLKAYPIFNPKVKATIGGAEVQLHMLATELAKKKDLDVHFMVADYAQKEVEEYEGVKVWRSLDFKSSKLAQIWSFFKVFNRIDADVYVQRTLTVESGLIALYSKLRRKKFVYMVAHDSEADGTHPLYKSQIKAFFAKLAFKLASVVFVQNEYQRENLSDWGLGKPKLLLSSWDIPERNRKRGEFILWVGRSVEWKKPEVFLALARNFPKEKFILICPPSTEDPNLAKSIEKEAETLKNVDFYSGIPFDEIDSFFENAKIYVITSKQEGFSNSMIQAMRMGVPVLSLSVNPNGLFTKNNCGIYCGGDVEKLKEGLESLLKEEAVYNSMSESAYRYTKENHDIKVNANKFLRNIDEI